MSDATDALADTLYDLPDEYGPVKCATRAELRALARDAYDLAQADLVEARAVIEQAREWSAYQIEVLTQERDHARAINRELSSRLSMLTDGRIS